MAAWFVRTMEPYHLRYFYRPKDSPLKSASPKLSKQQNMYLTVLCSNVAENFSDTLCKSNTLQCITGKTA